MSVVYKGGLWWSLKRWYKEILLFALIFVFSAWAYRMPKIVEGTFFVRFGILLVMFLSGLVLSMLVYFACADTTDPVIIEEMKYSHTLKGRVS